MKNRLFAIVGATMLAFSGVVGFGGLSSAVAQDAGSEPVILEVDMDRFVTKSKAGQTIPDQAEAVQGEVP
mgnify:CR=1 FL=1